MTQVDQSPDAFLDHHMPVHSGAREFAHRFLTQELHMGGVLPVERLAVLPNGSFGMTEGGHYFPDLNAAFIIDPKTDKPISGGVQRLTLIAHEFGHSETTDGKLAVAEHPLFTEAMAGFTEYKILRQLEELGLFLAPRDIGWTMLEGARLYVPSSVRKIDRREDTEPITPSMKVNSTNGLLAAISISPGLVKVGVTSAQVLQGDGPTSRRYDQLKEAVEAIKPGLVEKIEQTGMEPGAVYEAAALVQKTVIDQAAKS